MQNTGMDESAIFCAVLDKTGTCCSGGIVAGA